MFRPLSSAAAAATAASRARPLYAPDAVFCEENAKRTAARFASARPVRMHAHQPEKKAAVLVPLCVVDGKAALLYTLRAARLKSHRGQVSFPGGMQDVSDRSLEETALRETKEELGIDQKDVEIWGSGNYIVTRKETCVLPIIGRIKTDLVLENLKVNASEVEDVFTVTLEDLCNPAKIGYTQFRNAYSTPVFLGGKIKIWGLTALMTNLFLSCLLPQKAYSHQIRYIPPIRSTKSAKGNANM